ncbi:MAG: hypothetical protein ABUS49_11265 [Acidobacteriota bacterium]
MLLLVAAALPALLGNQPAPADCVTLSAPKVNFRPNVARATSSPWVDSNAWRFIRNPEGKFCIDAPGRLSALAAAEAFAYGVAAFIRSGPDGAAPFHSMLEFLRELPPADLPPLANIGFVDDGSAQSGELMNLLSRRNLLYQVEKKQDPRLDVNVTHVEAGDPSKQAYEIRRQLGDDKRLLRIYGTEVVIGRLTGSDGHARLHLVNYSQRPVTGIRVRVLGRYRNATPHMFGIPDAKLTDFSVDGVAAEFTIVNLNEYAVIDLTN